MADFDARALITDNAIAFGGATPDIINKLSLQGHDNTGRHLWRQGADIASATTLTIPDSVSGSATNFYNITGTTTIAGINAKSVGAVYIFKFNSALTLQHTTTSFEMPGGADLSINTDDSIIIHEYSSGNFRVISISQAVDVNGLLKSVQVFVASGTWTKPVGINSVHAQLVGSGGGGGGGGAGPGSGGGAGGYSEKFIDVTATSNETVTVGVGGAGGVTSGNGSGGGSTSFGAFLSATGGGGGLFNNITPGGGGSGGGGDHNENGGDGNTMRTDSSWGGHGGSSFFGGGGYGGGSGGTSGQIGKAHGSGGGGGGLTGSPTGGNGKVGRVIVWEYS